MKKYGLMWFTLLSLSLAMWDSSFADDGDDTDIYGGSDDSEEIYTA